MGILFAIVIASLTKTSKGILLNDAKLSDKSYLDMIEAFESMLCYWSWLKKEEFWDINDHEDCNVPKHPYSKH